MTSRLLVRVFDELYRRSTGMLPGALKRQFETELGDYLIERLDASRSLTVRRVVVEFAMAEFDILAIVAQEHAKRVWRQATLVVLAALIVGLVISCITFAAGFGIFELLLRQPLYNTPRSGTVSPAMMMAGPAAVTGVIVLLASVWRDLRRNSRELRRS
jgi:hypothetical protein